MEVEFKKLSGFSLIKSSVDNTTKLKVRKAFVCLITISKSFLDLTIKYITEKELYSSRKVFKAIQMRCIRIDLSFEYHSILLCVSNQCCELVGIKCQS